MGNFGAYRYLWNLYLKCLRKQELDHLILFLINLLYLRNYCSTTIHVYRLAYPESLQMPGLQSFFFRYHKNIEYSSKFATLAIPYTNVNFQRIAFYRTIPLYFLKSAILTVPEEKYSQNYFLNINFFFKMLFLCYLF